MGGPILAQEEIKTIFGSIPDIYDVHTRIKVGNNLSKNWVKAVLNVLADKWALTGGSRGVGDELVWREERRRHYPEICECDSSLNSTSSGVKLTMPSKTEWQLLWSLIFLNSLSVWRAGEGLPTICQLLWDEQRDYSQMWETEAEVSCVPEGTLTLFSVYKDFSFI